MRGWLPAGAWWCIGAAGTAVVAYLVLANAIDILCRRWARRLGCPVCGAGPVGSEPGGAGAGTDTAGTRGGGL
jgi:hypothetical protein